MADDKDFNWDEQVKEDGDFFGVAGSAIEVDDIKPSPVNPLP